MDELILVLVFFLLFYGAPLAVSIVALAKVKRLNRDVADLQRQLAAVSSPPPVAPPPLQQKEPVNAAVPPPMPEPSPVPAHPDRPPKPRMEFAMGGKGAAFVGIAILVSGVALLVGYAIQQAWIGPGMRVLLGLIAGGGLVGLGHFTLMKDVKYRTFAQVLTGGGSALFYFTVFAAYSIYSLIGVWTATAGLCASAFAVFALAMVYRSQAVAVLGVLGAFITPLLIGVDFDAQVFPLVYVAVVNVPVILLGVRRRWQVLYNVAFGLTLILFLSWIDRHEDGKHGVGLAFAGLYFLEYAALGLLKLRRETQRTGRIADWIRLTAASVFLLGSVFGLMRSAGWNDWIGSAFVLTALLHAALAAGAARLHTRFDGEILAFLAGGLTAAVLALPAQLDGAWVSLGWAVEGIALAWFAGRVRSPALRGVALLLGMVGILKGLLHDFTFYDNSPALFFNARFGVGLVSALLLAGQGWLIGRQARTPAARPFRDGVWCMAAAGLLVIFCVDLFWTCGWNLPAAWWGSSLLMAGLGGFLVWQVPYRSSLTVFGSILLLLVPLKLLLLDGWIASVAGLYDPPVFGGWMLWSALLLLGALLGASGWLRGGNDRFLFSANHLARGVELASIVAMVGLITQEFLRAAADWAVSAITIWWAVCALGLILYGMRRRVAPHRYLGLLLFGLAAFKVLFIDSAELSGLARIAAFMGTGALMLTLSFVYMKAAAYFNGLERQP